MGYEQDLSALRKAVADFEKPNKKQVAQEPILESTQGPIYLTPRKQVDQGEEVVISEPEPAELTDMSSPENMREAWDKRFLSTDGLIRFNIQNEASKKMIERGASDEEITSCAADSNIETILGIAQYLRAHPGTVTFDMLEDMLRGCERDFGKPKFGG